MIFYFYGEFTKAYQCIKAVEKLHDAISGMSIIIEYNFYHSLILLALYPNSAVQQTYWKQIIANQNQMKIWSDHCQENFYHKYLLVKAEIARIEGNTLEAMDLYDQAIASARENEFIQHQALANELAANFWLALGKAEIAQLYLKKAHYGYQLWGTKRKVEQLEEKYPQWLIQITLANRLQTNATVSVNRKTSRINSTTGASESLDLSSLMKAAQTLSGEIVLNRLFPKMMHIVIENAGAEIGFLLLPRNDTWFIEAQGQIDSDEVQVLQSIPVDKQPIALTIIQYVARTQAPLVLQDATQDTLIHFMSTFS